MAAVLLAEDERLGRQVAVKRLHTESPEDAAQRFRREARLGASLNHPNLVSVYDIVSDDEGVLIVMEYVDGETLRDATQRGQIEPKRAIEVLRGVAEALEHAHSEGIVHRDVKPANVLLGRDGRVKLADLGIATAVEGTRITKSGTVMGTAAYMAPEQLEGQRPGPEADLYSLAVVAWEMLSGQRAYEGRTPIEIARRKASDPPPSLAEVWPGAPPAAVAALQRAMAADASVRPSSPTAFVEELEHALTPVRAPEGALKPAPARQPAPEPAPKPVPVRQPAAYATHQSGERSRSRLLPVAALLLAIALGAAAVFAFAGGSSSSGSKKPPAAEAGKKKAKKQKKSREAPAPSGSQPAAPAAAPEPSSSGYQVPVAAGSSAAQGAQLNTEGKQLIDAGNYAAAIPVLERALRAFPTGTTAASNLEFAFTLYNLGHALRAGGRPADAVPVLEERLENPNQSSTVQTELDAARQAAGQG
jgi:eukaryotic-like serine/threonine-protein kinase